MDSVLIRRLTWLVERALMLLCILISLVVFLQVLFRYLLRQPLFWSEELPRYLLSRLNSPGVTPVSRSVRDGRCGSLRTSSCWVFSASSSTAEPS